MLRCDLLASRLVPIGNNYLVVLTARARSRLVRLFRRKRGVIQLEKVDVQTLTLLLRKPAGRC